MNRAHRTPERRLAALSTEDRDLFASRSAEELADQAEQLRHRGDVLARELERVHARRSAVEVLLDRALAAAGRESITVRRADGAEVVWTPQADGTGFHRVRINRPIRREVGP